MTPEYFRRGEGRVQNAIKQEYAKLYGSHDSIICDGIVNPERYVASGKRILWFLKEPYDNGEAYNDVRDGGWSLTEDCMNQKTDRTSRQKAFQPICYIDYGLRKNINDWDEMPWLRDSQEIRDGLKNIAFINVLKLPGLKASPSSRIVEGYQKHRQLLLDQITAYAPEIIFACDPHADLIKEDLGMLDLQWKWFGTAAALQVSANQKLVFVQHPSQRSSRRNYINDAIKAATAP